MTEIKAPAIASVQVKRAIGTTANGTRHRVRIVTAHCTCGNTFIDTGLPPRASHKKVVEIVVEAYVRHMQECWDRSGGQRTIVARDWTPEDPGLRTVGCASCLKKLALGAPEAMALVGSPDGPIPFICEACAESLHATGGLPMGGRR
jgi:hypothetical protein